MKRFFTIIGWHLVVLHLVVLLSCSAWSNEAKNEWKKIVDKIGELGCDVPIVNCEKCDDAFGGSQAIYRTDGDKLNEIRLCSDRIDNRESLKRLYWHELVHAYDRCKFSLDAANLSCRQRACTEVRAYSYSTRCNKIDGTDTTDEERKACVKEEAIDSTDNACPRTATADVEAVFDSCYLSKEDYNSKWLFGFDENWIRQ